jgi:hypothetical protein
MPLVSSIASLAGAIVIISGSVLAAEGPDQVGKLGYDDYPKIVNEREKQKSDAVSGVAAALEAGCDVQRALLAAVSGNRGGFSDALDAAEKKLNAAAEQVDKVAGSNAFTADIPQAMQVSLKIGGNDIKTYGDLLREISKRAKQSAAAIVRMREGHGTEGDISLIAENEAIISNLVSILYGLTTKV